MSNTAVCLCRDAAAVYPVRRNGALITAAAFILLLSNATQGIALTIRGNFIGGQPAGPTFGGGHLVEIFEAAARVWEQAIPDDFTVIFDYGWGSSSTGVFGSSHSLLAQGRTPNRETRGLLLFNNEVAGSGPDLFPLFSDPTPMTNEEFPDVAHNSRDFGGGSVNVARRYSTPGFDFQDLFSIALHEIGHGLGLSLAHTSFIAESIDGNVTITGPLAFAGSIVPVASSHLDVEGPLMSTSGLGFNTRVLPSELDILVMAQLSGFRLSQDTIAPEIFLTFDASTFNIVLFARDLPSGAVWGPLTPTTTTTTTWPGSIDLEVAPTNVAYRQSYEVVDSSGNLTLAQVLYQPHQGDGDLDPGVHAARARLLSVQYQGQPSVNLLNNRTRFEWRIDDNMRFMRLDQSVRIADLERVNAIWRRAANITQVHVLLPLPEQTMTFPGLRFLTAMTENGRLDTGFLP